MDTKRILIVLVAAGLAVAACKADISVETIGPQVKGPFTTKPTETSIPPSPQAIATDTAELYVTWGLPKAARGDRVKATLVAVDVGAAAPAGSTALETEVEVPDDGPHWGNFTFKKPPAASWPKGSYRVDVRHGPTVVGQVAFRIE